ncbi:MAG: hypothetical protein ABSH36_02610 [Solirubrobacteraceae bacterium]
MTKTDDIGRAEIARILYGAWPCYAHYLDPEDHRLLCSHPRSEALSELLEVLQSIKATPVIRRQPTGSPASITDEVALGHERHPACLALAVALTRSIPAVARAVADGSFQYPSRRTNSQGLRAAIAAAYSAYDAQDLRHDPVHHRLAVAALTRPQDDPIEVSSTWQYMVRLTPEHEPGRVENALDYMPMRCFSDLQTAIRGATEQCMWECVSVGEADLLQSAPYKRIMRKITAFSGSSGRWRLPQTGATLHITSRSAFPAGIEPLRSIIGREPFALDRRCLAESLGVRDEDHEESGLERFGETPAEQIAGAIDHAERSGALVIPDGVELITMKLAPEARYVSLALRETYEVWERDFAVRAAAGLPLERQLTTWSIDPSEAEDVRTYGDLCHGLEEVCRYANELMPSLRALLDGEQRLLDLVTKPLLILTYHPDGWFTTSPSGVEELTEEDPRRIIDSWPGLLEVLERGDSRAESIGRGEVRAYHLKPEGESHLARQLVEARALVLESGDRDAAGVPEPAGGLHSYIA